MIAPLPARLLAALLCAGTGVHAARERLGGDDPAMAQVELVTREGDLARAVELLDAAIRRAPRAYYYAIRGGLRGELRDLSGALEDLDHALLLDPKLAIAWRDRGTARVLRGEFKLAREDFDTAVRLDPQAAQAWAARAALHLLLGNWEAAVADATAALELEPQLFAPRHDRAIARMESGDLRGALADLSTVLAAQPRHPVALTSRAQAHRRLGDLESALQDASSAVLADANFPGAYAERATIRGARGDFAGGIADCATALLIDPGYRDALAVRALLCTQSGDFAQAREDLEKVLAHVESEPAIARRDLAWLLATCPEAGVRDSTRAVALAREAIEQYGDRSPGVFDALAAAAADLGDFVAAIDNAERSVQATPLRTPMELAARRERLELYRQQRPYRLPAGPAEAPAAGLARDATETGALLRAGAFAKARALLEEAVRHRASVPARTLSTLAWLLATCPDDSLRDGPRAVQLARQSLAAEPDAEGFDALAAALAETGDFPAAIETAQQALERTDAEDAGEMAHRRERLERYRNAGVWRLPPAAAAAPAPRAAFR